MGGQTEPHAATAAARNSSRRPLRLPDIATPVLLIGCDRDAAFSKETHEEAAWLIPDCTLRKYENTMAFQAITDSRIAVDMLDFVEQRCLAETT